jgi:hypothetical protein
MPTDLFPSDFLTRILYAFIISPISRPSDPPWFYHQPAQQYSYLVIKTITRVLIMQFSLHSFYSGYFLLGAIFPASAAAQWLSLLLFIRKARGSNPDKENDSPD